MIALERGLARHHRAAASALRRFTGNFGARPQRLDPALIPHEDEKRRVTTQINQEPKHQVSAQSFGITRRSWRSARVTLSRWRLGFKSVRTTCSARVLGWSTDPHPPVGSDIGPSYSASNVSRRSIASRAHGHRHPLIWSHARGCGLTSRARAQLASEDHVST
jgi:hypothetical protein